MWSPWSPGSREPGPGLERQAQLPLRGRLRPRLPLGRNLVTNALAHDPLSLGFAVAFGTRNTLGTGCNDVVSAETVMMIKERFIEQYGIPKFTIGSGRLGRRHPGGAPDRPQLPRPARCAPAGDLLPGRLRVDPA